MLGTASPLEEDLDLGPGPGPEIDMIAGLGPQGDIEDEIGLQGGDMMIQGLTPGAEGTIDPAEIMTGEIEEVLIGTGEIEVHAGAEEITPRIETTEGTGLTLQGTESTRRGQRIEATIRLEALKEARETSLREMLRGPPLKKVTQRRITS